MFWRLLGYAPSRLIPAVISIASIYLFTRILSPIEFGLYGLALSIHMIVVTCLFSMFSVTAIRNFPVGCSSDQPPYLVTVHRLVFVAAGVLAGLVLPAFLVMAPSVRLLAIYTVLLTVFRGIMGVNQGLNQITDRVGWFSLIECVNAVLGLVVPLALIGWVAPTAENMMLGLLIAAAVCVILDYRQYGHRAPYDRVIARTLIHFAVPGFGASFVGTFLMYLDRLTLSFGDSTALGIYTVALSLMERPVMIVATIIMTAVGPLTIQTLETQGVRAGQQQAARNTLLLLLVLLPCCAGIVACRDNIAMIMIGEQFRPMVIETLPWLAIIVLMRIMSVHVFDSLFFLARRPEVTIWIYVPVTLISLVIMGAGLLTGGLFGVLVATLICQVILLVTQIMVSRRLFPLPVTLRPLVGVSTATSLMVVAVWRLDAPHSAFGLIEQVSSGAVVYVAAILLLGVLPAMDLLRLPKKIYVFVACGRSGPGGMSRMVDYFVSEWERLGWTPLIRVFDTTGPVVDRTRVAWWRLWRQPMRFTVSLWHLSWGAMFGQIAVLHLNVAERSSVFRKMLMIVLAKWLHIPVVVHMHAASFVQFYARLSPRVQRMVSRSFRRADRFIVLGTSYRDYFVRTVGLDPQRIEIVHNAVALLAPYKPCEGNQVPRLLFAGVLSERKGLRELIAALAATRDRAWTLTIVGDGDPTPWQQQAQVAGLGHLIEFLGWQPARRVHELLSEADALVLPSHEEGLPLVVIEAMAHGRPVIATSVGSVEEAVTHNVTGLIVPAKDVPALTGALRAILDDPILGRRLGAEGRRCYEAKFTISTQSERLKMIFDAVCREAGYDDEAVDRLYGQRLVSTD